MYLLTFFSVSVSVRRSDLCAHGMAYIPVPSPPTAARAEAALPGSPGAPRLPSSGAPRSASGSTPLGSGAPPAAGPPSTCPPPAAAGPAARRGARRGTGRARAAARMPEPGAVRPSHLAGPGVRRQRAPSCSGGAAPPSPATRACSWQRCRRGSVPGCLPRR